MEAVGVAFVALPSMWVAASPPENVSFRSLWYRGVLLQLFFLVTLVLCVPSVL